MDKFWKGALGIGGISAIGAFFFLSLYNNWLSLDIFSTLDGQLTFILMIIFLSLTFISLIAFLLAFLNIKKKEKASIHQEISGEGIGVISTGNSEIEISRK